MPDCHAEMLQFYRENVRLPGPTQKTLRGHRKANQERLKSGLEQNHDPQPDHHVKQGSYAMRTMVQYPANDYDIDDGAVFLVGDLVDGDGSPMSPNAARKMVCGALQDGRFKNPPENRGNCVRVFYHEGHHVDIPVYRQMEDPHSGEIYYEIAAGNEWKKSNPRGVTSWFNDAVEANSPDLDDGGQMRRIVCLLKMWARSRKEWELPSGLIFSILVNERYVALDRHDDTSLHLVMEGIKARLDASLVVRHPVNSQDFVTKTHADQDMLDLRDRLGEALLVLDVLKHPDCTKKMALKAWSKVFNVDFFQEQHEDSAGAARVSIPFSTMTPREAVQKAGANRLA